MQASQDKFNTIIELLENNELILRPYEPREYNLLNFATQRLKRTEIKKLA